MSGNMLSLKGEEAGDVVICADRFENYELAGRLYSRHISGYIPFRGITAMIEGMDAIFKERSDRQKPYEYRTFRRGKKTAMRMVGSKEVVGKLNNELLVENAGEKATFIVKVQFQQNATWQGTISWTDKKKTQRFRSALEMIKLMDVALAEDLEDQAKAAQPEAESASLD